ncbi:MAG: endo-1,4-beta-xylanase [Planctomycetota bacterium]|nr:endo-1,4-beta-xylanase [Planctomycetota bacterium]MDA1213829.1 endo-1,4-beta-xylanase [Planctomycetota bacterium]
MGVMRFMVRPPELVDALPDLHRAYITGIDSRIFPIRVDFEGEVMACRRQTSESGRLHVAFPIPGYGSPVIGTSSLREQDEPYVLAVELARGKISQIRDQIGAWEIAGMEIPAAVAPLMKEAQHLFAQSTAGQSSDIDEASRLAILALEKAFAVSEIIVDEYARQRLLVRRRRTSQLPAFLGCNLADQIPQGEQESLFLKSFQAVGVGIEWKSIEPEEGEYFWEKADQQVEWATKKKLLVRGGPLLDLGADGLPRWLWQWEHDFLNMQHFVCDFVQTAISRFVSQIRQWEVACRVNTGGALTLSEEQRLTLVARVLEAARKVDDETQLLIRIDQPWGEYQARGQHRLSPLQFVDALVRSGLGLSGINLEINIGYRPLGTASRDVLDFSRLIDLWSSLGIPIYLTLGFPSCADQDPRCRTDLEVGTQGWKGDWNEENQAAWVEMYMPLLLAKPSVVGIYWTHLSDQGTHECPHAGLFRADGSAKPVVEQFIRQRQSTWDT